MDTILFKRIHKNKKSISIGRGGTRGKTSGRGTKGQKSRSGYNLPRKFEGGQTPIIMRLHKLPGFKSTKAKAQVITLDDISRKFKSGETITLAKLIAAGLIKTGEKAKVRAAVHRKFPGIGEKNKSKLYERSRSKMEG